MNSYQVSRYAGRNLTDIYVFSIERWGVQQADRYLGQLYRIFDGIAARSVLPRAVQVKPGLIGWRTRCEKHDVYWQELSDGTVLIRAVLHQQMDASGRLAAAFGD